MKQLVGLIGDPVAHSLSPLMHNAALAAMGLDWVYVPFAVVAAELETAVGGLWALGCQGFNVTIPHKQAVLPYLVDLSPAAAHLGAVNTVRRTPEGWWGENTDYLGFMAPLEPLETRDHVLILGSGGAARGAIYGCIQLGFKRVSVWGRNPVALQHLAQDFPGLELGIPQTLSQVNLVVNTTPLGMTGYAQVSPLSAAQLDQLSPHAWVYDLVYTPLQTPLLQAASLRGLKTLGGLPMLVVQGAQALALWTGQTVPVAVMFAVAQARLEATTGFDL